MEAKLLEIEGKAKTSHVEGASVSDFRFGKASTVDARVILEHPQTTLYCVDDEHRQAVFVESPPDLDLSQRPYYFNEQYQHAQRVLTVSYETLHELAAAATRFKRLIPMYSVGRCGGTLMRSAMNRLDNVLSLDEPDVYNGIAMLRPADGSRDAELSKLLHSVTVLMFRPMKPGADTLFLKFRPTAIGVGDLLHQAFPDAHPIFLYRNAETWARSAARSIQSLLADQPPDAYGPTVEGLRIMDVFRTGGPHPAAPAASHAASHKLGDASLLRAMPSLRRFLRRNVLPRMEGSQRLKLVWLFIAHRFPILRDHCQSPQEFLKPYLQSVPPMKLLTLVWVSNVEFYVTWQKKGVPILGLQYETLTASPEAALRALFEYCELPMDQVAQALGAFAEDSHKDSPLARERVGAAARAALDPAWLAQLREVLVDFPDILKPDVTLPNSLALPQASRATS